MKTNFRRLALAGAVVLLPLVLSYILIYYHLGAGLPDYTPLDGDEITYWHSTATFIKWGFNGGYYTLDERTAPARFTHFDAHGPMFPVLYGLLGRLFGWRFYTPLLFNVAIVTVALALFLYFTKPDALQMAVIGAGIATFWPLLLMLPALYQQSLHQAFALVLAAMFYHLISQEGDLSLPRRGAFIGFLSFISLLKPTWALLSLPYFLLTARDTSRLRLAIPFLKAAAYTGAAYLSYSLLAAPYPNFRSRFLRTLLVSFPAALRLLIGRLAFNLGNFHRGLLTPLEVLQRYQLLFLMVAACVMGIRYWKRTPPEEKRPLARRPVSEAAFYLSALVPLFGLEVSLHEMILMRDTRVFAPYLLLSLLLLILFRRWWVAGLLIASNLVATPLFLNAYAEIPGPHFSYDQESIAAFGELTAPYIQFQEGADPWCNTLAVVTSRPELLSVPPGIGLDILFRPDSSDLLELPLKSRYLLLNEMEYGWWEDDLNVERLTTTPIGNLYLNLDAACD
ncbi:MAG TPA: hypothetical protein ENI95_08645 [Chloroflexi bacterium]|nr:hypothetical protein [Chloroflexota bacterium]